MQPTSFHHIQQRISAAVRQNQQRSSALIYACSLCAAQHQLAGLPPSHPSAAACLSVDPTNPYAIQGAVALLEHAAKNGRPEALRSLIQYGLQHRDYLRIPGKHKTHRKDWLMLHCIRNAGQYASGESVQFLAQSINITDSSLRNKLFRAILLNTLAAISEYQEQAFFALAALYQRAKKSRSHRHITASELTLFANAYNRALAAYLVKPDLPVPSKDRITVAVYASPGSSISLVITNQGEALYFFCGQIGVKMQMEHITSGASFSVVLERQSVLPKYVRDYFLFMLNSPPAATN